MRFEQYLNEAFLTTGMDKATSLIVKVLEKRLGIEMYPFGGSEGYIQEFKKANGNSGYGYIFVLGDGRLLRFNGESHKKSSTISSIDVWSKMQDLHPSKTLNIPENYNVIYSINKIVKFIKNSKLEESLDEGRGPGEKKKKAAKEFGIDVSIPANEFGRQVRKKKKELSVKKGSKEKSTRTKEVKEVEKTFEKQERTDPDVLFQDLEDLVQLVSSGVQKSLLVTGMAGIGKTYTVTEELTKMVGKENNDGIVLKGKSTPYGLYSSLFLNRNKLIVFDDMDSVFDDKNTINMLKTALDSSGENEITGLSKSTTDISKLDAKQKEDYYTKLDYQLKQEILDPGSIPAKEKLKLPSSFDFTGQIIFISNLQKDNMDKAILSRSFAIDITLQAKDVFKRMKSILSKIMPGTSMTIKKESLNFLKEANLNKQVNIRTLLNAIKCRSSGNPRGQHLVEQYA